MAGRIGFRQVAVFVICGALLGGALLPVPVLAQSSDLQPLLNKLERMERDIRVLSRQVYSGGNTSQGGNKAPRSGTGAAPRGKVSQAYLGRVDERISLLETELRLATGNVEKINHLLRQISTRLDKLVSDVDFRLSKLERAPATAQGTPGTPGAPGAASSAGPQLSTVPKAPAVTDVGVSSLGKKPGTLGTITQTELNSARRGGGQAGPGAGSPGRVATVTPPPPLKPPSILPEGPPKEQYDFARSLLFKGDFEKAARGFEEFIEAHPKQTLAANARYWLGETYYVRGDYRRAANIFMTGFKKAPKGNKATDTLLKLGMSLIGLDKKRDACATFNKLAKDFPNATASIKKKLVKERRRASCR